ncbi:tetraacyldisaccharide 4'-kinase [Myxococcus xanthus]|uniref:Tetraacyldisaccharide 4'-kinase n=1 Tax=Myxococcus xanthus TaxID=34 RepID=A0AAE6G2I2_MYXXA|nr:tetraacyldisaccharide 4'-kinase [Myxococcus xanthus]QDE69672.1 tetraacyldisaccharide 4'-kinase [Myxococcus xanthus]QDE76950.1 tetraacyldisaccharide 4'-kinase [Myxococcus xanthus]
MTSPDAPTAIERVFYPSSPEPWGRRALLSPLTLLSWTYAAAVHVRGALYDAGLLRAERVEGLKVISVGNVNVGGTGKTPAVLHLAEQLVQAGRKVGILTRGYGRASRAPLTFIGTEPLPSSGLAGDEPLLLARRCPQVRLFVGSDRVASAYRARDEFGLDTVLLDDGFQHRRLARDEDFVVVDESVGLGNGQLLPRGPLREPPASLRRATLFWLRASATAPDSAALPLTTTHPLVPTAETSERFSDALDGWLPSSPGIPRVRTRYRPTAWVDPEGNLHPVTALTGQPVFALAGLARPGAFLKTLQGLGTEVRDAALFPDHHRFTADELRDVQARAARQGARVVTTEKDAVRLPPGFEAWMVRLGVEVLDGESHLRRALGLEDAPRGL